MAQTKAVNFTNARNSHPVTFLHGQMQADKTHRMVADHEQVVHQHREAIFKIHRVTVEIIQTVQVGDIFGQNQRIQ